MTNCPKCAADITAEGLQSGRCPQCNTLIRDERKEAEDQSASSCQRIGAETTDYEGLPSDIRTQKIGPISDREPREVIDLTTNSRRSGENSETHDAKSETYNDAKSDTQESQSDPHDGKSDTHDGKSETRDNLSRFHKEPAIIDLSKPDSEAIRESDGMAGVPGRATTILLPRKNAPTVNMRPDRSAKTVDFETRTQSPDESGKRGESTLVIQDRVMAAPGAQEAVADYDLISMLGEGGMGVVYAARQASIDRTVAVKMLKPQKTLSESSKQKFLAEAVVTGELDHPNIVPIYDLGQGPDGALFYSMKNIQGTPWMDLLQKKTLPENLEILLKVCDAVAFAHARGILHRDLKPENVMLGEFGEVLVLDWGLAVMTTDCRKTTNIAQHYSLGGTPAYMAPEMVSGPIESIGKQSDIYLLGAILFECVSGRVPHTGRTTMECIRAAQNNVIVPTDSAGELMDIALKAMSTDPRDRHENVQALQNEIRDYQSHSESIALSTRAKDELRAARQSDDYNALAKVLYVFEEAYSLWDRNTEAQKGIVDAQYAYAKSAFGKKDYDLGLSILDASNPDHAGLIAALKSEQRERDARQQRLKTAKRAVVGLVAAVLAAVSIGLVFVNLQRARAVAAEQLAKDNEQKARTAEQLALTNEGIAKTNERIAKDNETLANKATAKAELERQKAEYEGYVALIAMAAAKIDENSLDQAREALDRCKPELRNWEWRRLNYLCSLRPAGIDVRSRLDCVASNADATRVVVAGGRTVRVYDRETEKLICDPLELDTPEHATAVAFVPHDANKIVIGCGGSADNLRIWNTKTGELQSLDGHEGQVNHVAFSKTGSHFVTAAADRTAMRWDYDSLRVLQTFRGHENSVLSAEFSPDETRIVTASRDKTVRIWFVQTGKQLRIDGKPALFRGHRQAVYSAAFSPDGRYVVSGGYDNRVLVWRPDELQPFDFKGLIGNKRRTDEGPRSIELPGHAAAVSRVQFSTDGERVLSASHDNSIRIWQLAYVASDTGKNISGATLFKTLRGHDSSVSDASFSPANLDHVVSAGFDHHVRFWDIPKYKEKVVILDGRHTDAVLRAEFSPSGEHVVTASMDRTAKTWTTENGDAVKDFREGHLYLASRAQFFPRGQNKLVTAAMDGTIRIWNLDTGTQLSEMQGVGYSGAVAVSDNGNWILTGSHREPSDGKSEAVWSAKLWDVRTGTIFRRFTGLAHQVTAVAISPDQKFVFVADAGGVGTIFEAQTAHRVAKLIGHTRRITSAAFVGNGKKLLTASEDTAVLHWNLEDLDNREADTKTLNPDRALVLRHPKIVTSLALTEDGRRVLTGCHDGQARYWDIESAELLWKWKVDGDGTVDAVALSTVTGQAIVLDSKRNQVSLLSLKDGTIIKDDKGRDRFLDLNAARAIGVSLAMSADAKRIAIIGADEVRLWNLETNQLQRLGSHYAVAFASYSLPNGEFIVSAGWDNSAKIWNSKTGAPLLKLAPDGAKVGSRIHSAVFSPIDNTMILTANSEGVARLWRWNPDDRTAKTVGVFKGHEDSVMHAVFSMDGKFVATCSRDKTVRIWNVQTFEPLAVLKGHTESVLQASFSPDGKRIVTAGEDMLAYVWNIDKAKPSIKLDGHTAPVNSVAYSPDGHRVLTGSGDRTVKVWDVNPEKDTAREILTLRGHQHEVTSVAFSRSGSAVSSSRDGVVILWLSEDSRPDTKMARSDLCRGLNPGHHPD